MNSTSISERENLVMKEIKDREMLYFSPKDISRFLNMEKRNVYQVLSGMESKGLIHRIESGRYILEEDYKSKDVYELASNLIDSSYLGFLSSLHFHGMINQVPRKIQIASTRRKGNMEIQGSEIHFVKIGENDFYGYENYDRIVVSDPEKTVIDCLRLPDKAGDFSNIIDIDWKKLDARKMTKYAEKTGSSSVVSRLGVIFERKGINSSISNLKDMVKHYSKFDPRGEEKNPNSEWKLYENREIE